MSSPSGPTGQPAPGGTRAHLHGWQPRLPSARVLPPIRTFTVGPGIPPGQPAAGAGHLRPGRGLSPPARTFTDPGARLTAETSVPRDVFRSVGTSSGRGQAGGEEGAVALPRVTVTSTTTR